MPAIIINSDCRTMPPKAQTLEDVPGRGLLETVLIALGYPKDQLPVGELIRSYAQLPGRWFVVSPIYWQATHNDAMILAAGEMLELSEVESTQWFNVFQAFALHEGLKTYYYSNHIWLINAGNKPDIQSKPVHRVLRQSMMPELETLDDSLYWQRFLTECQMHFSQQELNTNRPTLPINGVWLWGAGALKKPSHEAIYTDDEALNGLARQLSYNVQTYHARQRIPKNAILLFNNLLQTKQTLLEQQFKKTKTNWHWSNANYQLKPEGWLSRLWR